MKILTDKRFWLYTSIVYIVLAVFLVFFYNKEIKIDTGENKINISTAKKIKLPPLDKKDYDKRIHLLAGYSTTTYAELLATTSTTTISNLWPAKTVYPKDGAILPFKRIIAYYGNFFSKGMGVLGQYPEDEVIEKLKNELNLWNNADPETPAIPALHYIAVTAQQSPGEDGMYRLRMPHAEIDKTLEMAKKIDALVFLDIQVGFSTIQKELPLLKKYLELPNVHVGIDPEFSMKSGIRPGLVVGTYDAEDINFVINYLSEIVKEKELPPKVLVVHRYTQKMVTNYNLIKTIPEVQIVMHMDGWGTAPRKINTYKQFIYAEPVQFTGFKLFYKNDTMETGDPIMAPAEILKLTPKPIYIQYQ